MRELNGRTAIVTGASAGIGAAVARELSAHGMQVVLAARSVDKLEQLAAELRHAGRTAVAVPTDVADATAREHLISRTTEEFGAIDLLVNNAGIESFSIYHKLEVDRIIRCLDVNLTAALVLTRLALPHMIDAGRGHIINMSSTAGQHGPAYGAAYGASKAGLIAFTESLRAEYHGTGVSASVICPGFTRSGGIYDEIEQRIGRGTPLQMGGTSARAVARAVIRAIRSDLPEIIVNRPPMRPIFTLCAACPRLGEWIARIATARFLKRVATSRDREAARGK